MRLEESEKEELWQDMDEVMQRKSRIVYIEIGVHMKGNEITDNDTVRVRYIFEELTGKRVLYCASTYEFVIVNTFF